MDGTGPVPARRFAFPHGIAGTGATRRGGRHGLAHAEPPLCRTGHTEGPGRSRPRPGDPDRHRRSAGRGPTPSRPATCGARVPHTRARFPCTSTSMSFSHLWIGNGLPLMALKSGLRKADSGGGVAGRTATRWRGFRPTPSGVREHASVWTVCVLPAPDGPEYLIRAVEEQRHFPPRRRRDEGHPGADGPHGRAVAGSTGGTARDRGGRGKRCGEPWPCSRIGRNGAKMPRTLRKRRPNP